MCIEPAYFPAGNDAFPTPPFKGNFVCRFFGSRFFCGGKLCASDRLLSFRPESACDICSLARRTDFRENKRHPDLSERSGMCDPDPSAVRASGQFISDVFCLYPFPGVSYSGNDTDSQGEKSHAEAFLFHILPLARKPARGPVVLLSDFSLCIHALSCHAPFDEPVSGIWNSWKSGRMPVLPDGNIRFSDSGENLFLALQDHAWRDAGALRNGTGTSRQRADSGKTGCMADDSLLCSAGFFRDPDQEMGAGEKEA